MNTWCRQHETIGTLSYNRFDCFTLELPWQDNQTDVSCIPAGTYSYSVGYSLGAKRNVLRLEGVPGRTLINVEPGNYVASSLGCIFVANDLTFLDDGPSVDLSPTSRGTLDELIKLVPEEGRITISRCGLYPAR